MKEGFCFLIASVVFLGAIQPCSGSVILDPENVTHVVADVIQSGHLRLDSLSSSSMAEQLRLYLYVPQNDSRQQSSVTKVLGAHSYRMGQDEFGNAQIVLEWENPPLDADIDYLVETRVEVDERSSRQVRDFPTTDLTRPSVGIIEDAYGIGEGQTGVERLLAVGAWVNDHITYDSSYEQETLSARWVHENKKGVCDEFANLFLSMARALGYKSWYVAGYAFLGGRQADANSFGAHAWAEARFEGRTYSIDPTWAESPVDATHIAMARLPDSNFTELTEAKNRGVAIDWVKEETIVQLREFSESPRIRMDVQIVPDSAQSGKNVLLMADLLADGCVLSVASLGSCISSDAGEPLLDIKEPKRPVFFCGSDLELWTASVSPVPAGMMYTCPLVAASGGARSRPVVSLKNEVGLATPEIGVSTQKVLTPGQSLDAWVTVRNPGFGSMALRMFAMLGDQILEEGIDLPGKGTASVLFELKAPRKPGDHDLTIFSSSGDMATEALTVISERQLKITEIDIPVKVMLGESKDINITLHNFGGPETGRLEVSIGDHEEIRDIDLEENGTYTASFSYSPATQGEKEASITLLDSEGGYQDAWVGRIEASEAASFKEGISNHLEDFIAWLIASISSLFGF
ncbi:MAG: transglutaminase family protein [Candidatus Aenigmarchaeota archaeon]|nr:transglutaminase family protein [Candidatus Aenigmarchaeota archaeon]